MGQQVPEHSPPVQASRAPQGHGSPPHIQGGLRVPLATCIGLSCGLERTDEQTNKHFPGPAFLAWWSGEGLGVLILRAFQLILVHSQLWDHCPLAVIIL